MPWYAGVDVSKNRLHATVRRHDGEVRVDSVSVSNDEEGYQQLIRHLPEDHEHGLVGFEATGGYERGCVQALNEHTELGTVILNPHRVLSFARSKGLRTKTDNVDATTIAHYMQTHQPDPSENPSSARARLKELTRHLEHLKDQRSQEKTYKESVFDDELEASIDEAIQTYDEPIKRVKDQIKDHIEDHPELPDSVDFIVSITGIGEETARALLAEMKVPLNPEKLDPKAEVAHSGLAPEHHQSGSSLDTSSMSRRGNARIRKLLYFPTLSAIRHNPVIKSFYERLIGRGKKKMVAVVACMRKLLHIVVGVLKNQTEFDPQWEQKKA